MLWHDITTNKCVKRNEFYKRKSCQIFRFLCNFIILKVRCTVSRILAKICLKNKVKIYNIFGQIDFTEFFPLQDEFSYFVFLFKTLKWYFNMISLDITLQIVKSSVLSLMMRNCHYACKLFFRVHPQNIKVNNIPFGVSLFFKTISFALLGKFSLGCPDFAKSLKFKKLTP